MTTKINASQLRNIYGYKPTNYYNLLFPHKKKIDALATYRINRFGKKVKLQDYNVKQLTYIIDKVFGDTPEGYKFNGKTLVKIKDE